jgi:hypothetical protein
MQYAKAIKVTIVNGLVGTMTAVLLTFVTVPFASSTAEATAALAKGKPCGSCHSSSKPSKTDLKKK